MKIQRCLSGGRPRRKTIERRLNFLENLPVSVKDKSVILTAYCGLRKTYVRPKTGEIAEYEGFENLNPGNYQRLKIFESEGLVNVEMTSGNDFYRFSSTRKDEAFHRSRKDKKDAF